MKKNVNDVERVFRFAGGAFLSSMAFWGPKNKWMLGFAVPMLTGATGNCPLYSAMDISTRADAETQANQYMPVQSDSEQAAGHPIVGAS